MNDIFNKLAKSKFKFAEILNEKTSIFDIRASDYERLFSKYYNEDVEIKRDYSKLVFPFPAIWIPEQRSLIVSKSDNEHGIACVVFCFLYIENINELVSSTGAIFEYVGFVVYNDGTYSIKSHNVITNNKDIEFDCDTEINTVDEYEVFLKKSQDDYDDDIVKRCFAMILAMQYISNSDNWIIEKRVINKKFTSCRNGYKKYLNNRPIYIVARHEELADKMRIKSADRPKRSFRGRRSYIATVHTQVSKNERNKYYDVKKGDYFGKWNGRDHWLKSDGKPKQYVVPHSYKKTNLPEVNISGNVEYRVRTDLLSTPPEDIT